MTAAEAIRAFLTAHPTWRGVEDALSVKERDEWTYIVFQGSEIGRVKIEGRTILAEALWTTS